MDILESGDDAFSCGGGLGRRDDGEDYVALGDEGFICWQKLGADVGGAVDGVLAE